MAEIWKPKSNEVLQDWVDAILTEALDKLNEWESDFIDDIAIRVANGWKLTQSQEAKLESIYAEKTK